MPPGQDVTDSFLGISGNFLDGGDELLVGLSDDNIIATGGFKLQNDSTVEIGKMAVHPDNQRRGYGERILVELEDCDGMFGFDELVLETFESLTAARRRYEKHGYEETRRELDNEFREERIYYREDL